MRSSRRLPPALVLAATGLACGGPQVTLTIEPGAVQVENYSPAGTPSCVSLPERPLLNRFDLFEARGSDPPVGSDFVNHLAASPTERCAASDRDEAGSSDGTPVWLAGAPAAPVDGREGATTVALPLLSFVHVSDVQLRDATVKLGGIKRSKGLDNIVGSFEHDYQQELHLDQVLRALVKRINRTQAVACAAGDQAWCPAFVVHGGDAIDAGLTSELRLFDQIMDELDVPWLDMIGNHDVLAFGDLVPDREVTTRALLSGARPALTDHWYWGLMEWVSRARWKAVLDRRACPGCDATLVANSNSTPARFIEGHVHRDASPPSRAGGLVTRAHGFDLATTEQGKARGYYDLRLGIGGGTCGPAGPSPAAPGYCLRVVVLDTTDYADSDDDRRRYGGFGAGGEGGYLSAAQLDWLTQLGGSLAERELVLVFGHHPLDTIRNDGCRAPSTDPKMPRGCGHRLQAILGELSSKHRLVAYIAGHKHGHQVDLIGSGQDAFWQVQTGSLIGYPQEARWITLYWLDAQTGFLELIPFGVDENVGYDGDPLDLARRGARRDHCRRHECVDGWPVRQDGRHAAVRLFFDLPR